MISKQKLFGVYCCLLLVHSCVYAIYDPNDGNTKKGSSRTSPISEPIIMHHKYSQVASNRPLDGASTQSNYGSSRQGRVSYTNEAENYVAQYGLECPRNATGQFPYLLNCRQFLNCWKGRGYIQSCAPGTVFNPDTLECDNPAKVICLNYRGEANTNNQFARMEKAENDNYEDPPSAVDSDASTGYDVSENVKCPAKVVGLHPHPYDCAKYLNCANGVTYIQDCGPGTVFNPVNSVCDWPYKVDCTNRNSRKFNSSETVTVNQDEQYYTRTKPRVYHTINRHRNQDASIATSETDRIRESSLSTGYEDNAEAATSPYRSYPQVSPSNAESSQSSQGSMSQPNGRGPQGGWSTNFNHHHTHHRPGAHNHHHTYPPPIGWQQSTGATGNRGSSQGTWQQTTTHEGKRDPKYGWKQSVGGSSDSFSIDQAHVQEMPDSDVLVTNKTTIYYAKPVGTFDISQSHVTHQQQDVPSPFLQPPKASSTRQIGTETAARNKTVIYYAQPVGDYVPGDLRKFGNAASGWKPIQNLSSTLTNKTSIYYATPVDDYDSFKDYDEDDFSQQSQVPLDMLTPPDQKQSATWTASSRLPSSHSIAYPTNNKPLYDSHGQILPSQKTVPTSATYDQLSPPSPESVPPTIPIVPVPYGDLLPPMIDSKPTKESPEYSEPPVLYPPPESTKPLTVDNSRQERVFPVYAYPSIGSRPALNTASSVIYNTPYSGVAHSKSSTTNSNRNIEKELVPKKVVPIYTRPNSNSLHSKTMFDKTSTHLPPAYNHDYYNPPEAHKSDLEITEQSAHGTTSAEPTALPISEALKILLRPYFNRSGTVTEDVFSQMDQHIMKLSKANTSKAPSKNTTKKPPPTDSEAELIFSGEQDSMNQGTQHHQFDTSSENSHENSSQETVHRAGLHHRHNFHHFHKNHGPNCNHTHHNHHHHHHHHNHPPPNHRHHWHHINRTAGHSRDFHLRHPSIPSPFSTNDLDETDTPADRRQGAIDPRLDTNPTIYRRNFTEEKLYPDLDADKPACQFNCQNGKCVNEYQVCDGVNNCGNRLDEKDCDHIGFEVRLSSDEGKANMGRVEVKVRGQWGYVCDDKFGMRAADILCKELGFVLGASEVRGNSFYPPHKQMYDRGGVRYLMDEVDCLGNETSIRECNFSGWGVHDCSPDEVVGVVCKVPVMTCPPNYWLCKTSQECVAIGFLCDSVPDCQDSSDESEEMCNEAIQYRIIGGPSEMEGRVEVKYRDTWGTICDDDFGKREAQVICRTLGYLGEASIIKNAYGGATGPIWLDQVSCIGNETTLEQCSHWAWGEHNCDHKEDVSVKCSERLAHPRAEATTPTPISSEPEQLPEEDIDLYLYKVQRASKAINNNKRCGQINEHAIDEFDEETAFARVVNGTKAIRGHHPWQASLRAKGRTGMSTHWCGAILITQMHVLTAAHCLVGYQKEALFVRMGDHYSKIAEPSEIDSFIQNWYIHEEFRKGHHMNNDIGLIVLKSPVIFNDYIQPICLPPKDAKYQEGMKCTISGWGSIKSGISNPAPSNNLKAAHVPIISQAMCKEPYVYGKAITDGMFCAGYLDEGVDACDGDSGGPLACSSPNGETLYGIISWGQHCGQANKPGVYVKVSHYLDWIMDKIMYSIKAKHE